MNDSDKLGSSAVGRLVQRMRTGHMTDGHHPITNPFPEGG